MMGTEQSTGELEFNFREAQFEERLFKDGSMVRMSSEVFADIVTQYGPATGETFFSFLCNDVETFRTNDEWNREFASQVPADWLYPIMIEADVREAGAYDLVLSPTLAHAVAAHPDKRLLAELAYWQPLRVDHVAEVLRALKDGPLDGFWQQAVLDEERFFERQKAKGTPDEVIEQAKLLASDPEVPQLELRDYRKIDVAQQPEYVIRGLVRELGMAEELVRRLVPEGVQFLINRRYVGHKDDLDLGSIIANFNDSAERIDTTAIVSLIKRGAGSMAALLVMSGITAPNHSRAFDVSRRAQRRDSPFPELSSFKETLVEVARTVAEDGLYGGDRMGREMEISAKNRQPLVINTLREDERVDGELLEILFYCRMPRGKIQYILDRTEDVARLLFGIEKYQPDPDFINY